MTHARAAAVTVAIPILRNRISPVLDSAMRLLLVTCRDGESAGRREVAPGPLPPAALAGCLAELRVDIVLCSAVSLALLRLLELRGIEVQSHLCGNIDDVLHAFGGGTLDRAEFHMPGCHCDHCAPPACKMPRRHRRQRCHRAKSSRRSSHPPIS